jgi:nitroreductase
VELYEAMRTTPATRSFTDERVEDAVLHRMLEHARFAPNGGNRQGWRVIVLKDPAIRTRLWELYQLGWREYVEHGRQGLPFAARDAGRWTGPAIDLAAAREIPAPNDLADNLEHVPALLLIVADLGALAAVDNGLDRQSIVGGGSIYPFCHNLLLAACNEGLGGVLTTVLARQEPRVREMLGIPGEYALAGAPRARPPAESDHQAAPRPGRGIYRRRPLWRAHLHRVSGRVDRIGRVRSAGGGCLAALRTRVAATAGTSRLPRPTQQHSRSLTVHTRLYVTIVMLTIPRISSAGNL